MMRIQDGAKVLNPTIEFSESPTFFRASVFWPIKDSGLYGEHIEVDRALPSRAVLASFARSLDRLECAWSEAGRPDQLPRIAGVRRVIEAHYRARLGP